MINPPLGGQISKSPKRYKDARYKIQIIMIAAKAMLNGCLVIEICHFEFVCILVSL
jgi:hypothetical protein